MIVISEKGGKVCVGGRVHNETKVGRRLIKVDFKMILKVRSDEIWHQPSFLRSIGATTAPMYFLYTRLFRSLLGVESSYKNLFIKS